MSNIFQTINKIFSLSDIIKDFMKEANCLNAQGEDYPLAPSSGLFGFLNQNGENSNSLLRDSNVFKDLLVQNQAYSGLLNFFSSNSDSKDLNFNFDSKVLSELFGDENSMNFREKSDFVFKYQSEKLLNPSNTIYFDKENKNKPILKNTTPKRSIASEVETEKIESVIFRDETVDWLGERIAKEIKEASSNRSIL